jgi:hypothetical protein
LSHAPMWKIRPRLHCMASSPIGDGVLGSHAGRSRWCTQAEDLGARGSFPRPIHLHPPYLRLIPVPPIRLIHLHLALSRCPCRPQLGRRRHPHRRRWMRRRWPSPYPRSRWLLGADGSLSRSWWRLGADGPLSRTWQLLSSSRDPPNHQWCRQGRGDGAILH